MTITITAFAASPDRGRGQARDMRVRWALEELGLPYAVRLVSFDEMKQPAHLALQPFGQIPTFEEDGVALFESGAIVLHLAQRHRGLLPADPAGRARALSWLFAALSTMEPPILERETAVLLERERAWHAERLPLIEARIRRRLEQLSAALGAAEWLAGGFSAADLVMVGVLRRIEGTTMLEDFPGLAAYLARGTARPAYRRAYDAQHAVWEAVRDRA